MDEETFNMSVRKFLKKVGVTSQHELEQAVRAAVASGRLKGDETIAVHMRLETDLLDQPYVVDGEIKLA